MTQRYPWSTALPTAEGWYVFAYDAAHCPPSRVTAVCLRLVRDHGVLYVQPDNDIDGWCPVTDLSPGRWKGPLDLENL